MDKFVIRMRRDWDWNGLEITIARRRGDKWRVAKPVQFEFEEVSLGARMEPTIRIPWELEKDFLAAFAEALDTHGVKTESDAKLLGTLDATRYHPEDLRTLLRLRGKS